MVRYHAAVLIQAKIDVFDWLTEKQDKRIAKNPAGYLVTSIEKEYAAPPGFVPKAERQRLEEAHKAKDLYRGSGKAHPGR